MKIEAELHYSVPPAAVAAMTFDPNFQDRKCRDTGALHHQVDIAPRDSHTVITTRRSMPTDSLPDFATAFLRNGLVVEEIDDWGPAEADESRRGTIRVRIVDAPLTMTGTLRLTADGDSSVVHLDGDLKSTIPLVGGRIEQAAAPAILAAVRSEEKTARAWLSEHPSAG